MIGSVLGSIFNRPYSISELFNIDSGRQDKARLCKVTLEKVYHELKKETVLDKFKKFFFGISNVINVYYVIFKFKVTSETGSVNTVYIRTSPDFNSIEGLGNTVEVYCSCKDFMYRSAYNLNKRKSLFRSTKTDGALGTALYDAPKAKTKTTLLCKHAYAAVTYLMNNYDYLMKSI